MNMTSNATLGPVGRALRLIAFAAGLALLCSEHALAAPEAPGMLMNLVKSISVQ